MTLQEILKKVWSKTLTIEDEQYYVEHFMSDEEKQIGKPLFKMNKEEEAQYMAATYNNEVGDLEGFDCPKCLNKGFIRFVKDGRPTDAPCNCWSIRETINKMKNSGLGNLLGLYKFENYKCEEKWQQNVYDKAHEFLKDNKNWFYFGGQAGAGKSMICTAMVRELIKQGMAVKYMLWIDDGLELKQSVMDSEAYSAKIEELKNAQVLYIDDLFKTEKNTEPTPADIKLAFEILNYRYNKARMEKSKRYITIISSERSIQEILKFDEALGSRIYEMTKPDYYLFIPKSKNRNYRLKGMEGI